ncbi:hypothetical protein BDR07DRAFT_1441759 [Suillus spraguei]|nr:hypothetical protein BDR07DRAFT_1441759 [Suillus spraguei]
MFQLHVVAQELQRYTCATCLGVPDLSRHLDVRAFDKYQISCSLAGGATIRTTLLDVKVDCDRASWPRRPEMGHKWHRINCIHWTVRPQHNLIFGGRTGSTKRAKRELLQVTDLLFLESSTRHDVGEGHISAPWASFKKLEGQHLPKTGTCVRTAVFR